MLLYIFAFDQDIFQDKYYDETHINEYSSIIRMKKDKNFSLPKTIFTRSFFLVEKIVEDLSGNRCKDHLFLALVIFLFSFVHPVFLIISLIKVFNYLFIH